MALQNVSEDLASNGTEGPRTGSVAMVLLVALVLVAAAVGLLFVGRAHAEGYILTLLAGLAMIGVFSLFAGAAGILRLGAAGRANPLRNPVTDGASDGILVTDGSGRVVYANAAYLALVDARNEQ